MNVNCKMALLVPMAALALCSCEPGATQNSGATQPETIRPNNLEPTKPPVKESNEPSKAPSAQVKTAHSHTNRLAQEKSPYLLQHQHNPVDWYPWGSEAFEKARHEGKPIFLSIGYSTCHWCHVMERESFEDGKTAAYMNEHFVNIKVDREERPDVDKIYMTFVQATTGGGGWPMSVWLTPDLKPFFGGTYFPPDQKFGRSSFMDVLGQIAEAWKTQKADILASATSLHQRIADGVRQVAQADAKLDPIWLDQAVTQFKEEYDPRHGGFGSAPKFPRPSQPLMLLRHAVRNGDKDGIRMVTHTCERMAAGGMYDQIGGGFARYSVDDEWLIPHFEKMLYDNAQLLHLYLDVYLITGEERFASVVRDIIRYVLRDMTHEGGGFYSAEDADSEGKEGKFYCWTKDELKQVLSPEEFKVAVSYFGVTSRGNFVDHSDPEPLPNQNVLSIVNPKLDEAQARLLKSGRKKMFDIRAKRIRPHLDDKVLSSWNGLMLGAIARASIVLNNRSYLEAAEKNVAFLKNELWDAETGTLYHRWREGARDDVQLLDAYAFLMDGVLHLYEATLNPEHLQFATDLSGTMIEKFYDKEHGGFWQSTNTPHLIIQVKEDYDGAVPSGNSVAALALLRLGKITDRKDLLEVAEKTILLFADRLKEAPRAIPYMLQAVDFLIHEPRRAVIVGEGVKEMQDLLLASHAVYQPNKVVLGNKGPVEEFAKTLPPEGPASVYLCTGTTCLPPTGDPARLREMMTEKK